MHGTEWIPAETDVSIRPGWFWRESENNAVKSLKELQDIWLSSIGRNSLLLLNVPPDTSGRLHKADSARLMEFRAWRDKVFSNNLASGAKSRWKAHSIEITLPEERTYKLVMLQEDICQGQRGSTAKRPVENHSRRHHHRL